MNLRDDLIGNVILLLAVDDFLRIAERKADRQQCNPSNPPQQITAQMLWEEGNNAIKNSSGGSFVEWDKLHTTTQAYYVEWANCLNKRLQTV